MLRPMKRQGLVVMLLGVGLVCGCAWFAPRDVSGRWEGTAGLNMTGDGPKPCEIVLNLTEIDGAIGGTLRIVAWYEVYDVTGTLSGRHVEIEGQIFPAWVTLEGEVHGRTMSGTCTMSGETDDWEVTRVD
jgi:hypothetical protein